MKISLQYVSDSSGKPQAVQMSVTEWEKVLAKLKKYEQVLQIRTDLKEAFQQVEILRKTRSKKQTLTDLLDDDFLKKIEEKDTEPPKEQILQGVKQAVKEMNLIKAGKLKARDARELINEL